MAIGSKAATAAGVYLAAVNAGAAGLFWYDKKCAQMKQWRVPEATLCATALAGGWPGGMWAMQQFRHKTSKQSFQQKWNAAVATNVAGGAALAAVPSLRTRALQMLRMR
ncbi:hypothetical protein WJX72_009080 [[Myrmecia] bisecta]|uniref:Uncharacterized protein n=1 Tax=[Myrmecia] bisecta TaxID=41462 RepID=A0AAW1Q3A2_9CHLO